MCGIFGHIGNISGDLASQCVDTLAHRGPDGRGVWSNEGVTLGHRRLSILDLSDKAKQPMSYANDRFWITYNGEIYNFLELRDDLEKKGHVFKSDSDTEVILASFAEWGDACLERFNGMWAFAIWDEKEKQLFLSRDRFGKKPLFYTHMPSGFAFASEMKALFPLMPEVRANVPLVKDLQRIMRYESTEECVIEGIKRFPAGSWGILKNGKLSLKRWWNTLDHIPEVPDSYEEQVEEFRALFLDACRLRMRSDVPIGTALSGGLDSSSTISAMAHIARHDHGSRISDDWQHAFVACFPGTPLDESHYAKMVTDHLGIGATFLDMDPLQAIDRLYEYFYLFEDIYITSPIPFMLTYGSMRSHGVKVTIDGHGADELYGGYSFDYVSALADAGLNIDNVRMVLDTYYDAFPKESSQFRLPSKGWFWSKWYGRHIAKKILRPKYVSRDISEHPHWKSFDNLGKTLYLSSHSTILPTILRNYDRYSMANGVEIRMPFMDHRIVSYAFALPWSAKIRNGFSKSIIRDAIAPYLPHDVVYRKSKIGFNSPIVDWMKGPLKTFFLDTVRSNSFRSSDLIDAREVEIAVRKVIEDPRATFSMGEKAWSRLALFLWEEAVINRNYKRAPQQSQLEGIESR